MKLPILNIPLVWFPAVGSFLSAMFFILASVDAVQDLAQPDFDSISATIVLGISVLTLACSIALVFRKAWARKTLVLMLSTLAVLLIVTAFYDLVSKSREHEDVVFRLVATPFLVLILALNVAFLLNRPFVSELLEEDEEANHQRSRKG